ncbi:CHAT domain-containing tetratricopeptide repeat protein [Microcoleus sp. CAWBG58]|uniref:CHAT domain-containing protein n=1 Tax=Microcoleus sp. CAWBG58 TaxID=2841651 RepID=UPI0025D0DA3F|nr:CHAT domain-containing tetratricopeptide repeat protein [Microcoleus sp. CAWBG58]
MSSSIPDSVALSNRDSQLDFLLQVLKAISDSEGDPQVVYPLLQAKLEKLDEKFTQYLQNLTTAILQEEESDEIQSIAIDIAIFSDLIREFTLGDPAINLEIAIIGYEFAATVFTPGSDPQVWAEIKNNLGLTYYNSIWGKRAENLEAAIRHFLDALEVYTCEAFPEEWAMTQNNLGNAYCERIWKNRTENVEVAIRHFLDALEVYTCEAFPEEWAMTQNNLGNAYCERIQGEKAENLEIAIHHYTAALKVYTYLDYSSDWAMTQLNLGTAYLERIWGEKAENLELAIQYFLASLEVYTSSSFPYEWAMVQHNLGNVYSDRIQGERKQNLEKAIEYFCAALEVRTFSNFPNEWAETQNNLGNAYSDRIQGEISKNLETSIHCFSDALKVHKREVFSERWANIQNNQGNIYLNRICGERAENLETAIRCFLDALEVYTRDAFPEKWAMTQNNLAIVYSDRIRGERAENLEAAIRYFSDALQVYTRDAFPQDWAMTQNNLGTTYCERIREERAENLETAIRCFLDVLEVCTRDTFPEQWAETQNNLGLAYFYSIRDEKGNNIESAIRCYDRALEVYICNDFPRQWAITKNNLGLSYLYRIQGEKPENLETAIDCFQGSLEVHTREAFPENHAKTQFALGLSYQKYRRFYNAYNAYAAAISTVESLRVEIVSGSGVEEDKKKLAEQWNILYQNMIEVCLEIAKYQPQYYNQAIEYVERSKARNLVELLANKDIYPKRDFYPYSEIYPTHCHQLEQLRRQIPAKQREIEILISSSESEKRYRNEIEQRQQSLTQLQQKLDKILAKINQIDSSFAFTQKVQPIPFSDIQSLTDENTAIVEWYITDSQILTFIITRHHPHPMVVASEDMTALENWDHKYRDSYQNQKIEWINNLASRLQNLAEILHIDDILSSIDKCFSQSGAKCKRLILIPHRYLHLFPLHALPLADGKLLLERFPKGVGYAPSCQLLKQAKDQEQHRPDFTRLFAIQNPTRQPARPLLGSQLEIDKIHQNFDPQHSIILKEAEATEANLYQLMEQIRSSHCLHFSCHGEFHHKSPLESALLLANPEGKLGKEEAKLTLGEVFEKLYLNQCRLVTFSACESGMTDPHSISDEYIGLPSGFLYAGSPSIVSTLWSVDPIATTLLMVKFYHNLKQLPQIKTGDVAISLNKTQKWLKTLTHKKWARIQSSPQFQNLVEEAFKNSPKRDRNKFKDSLSESLSLNRQPLPFANPYYWSAFVAIGI